MARATTLTINPLEMIYPAEQITISCEEYPTDTIFAKNIEALQKINPELADTLSQCQLPDRYQLGICSDGVFSYRIANPQDNTSYWLGSRSAPSLAAQADIARLTLGQSNTAVNGFGDGYTIVEAIKNFMPFQAIFVLESNILNIKANLLIHDFSKHLQNGQLVIIYGEDTYQKLTNFLQSNPGYQIIEKAVFVHRLSEQENNQFNIHLTAAVEKALQSAADISQDTNQQLQNLEPRAFAADNASQLTIATLPCGNSPSDTIVAREIIAGFAACGYQTYLNTFSSPQKATTIAQSQSIISQKPDAILLINSLRKMANYSLPESMPIISILPNLTAERAADLAGDSTGPNDIIVCPKKCIGSFKNEKLTKQAIELGEYINPAIYHPLTPEQLQADSELWSLPSVNDVIILTARNPIDLEQYNIRLSSHVNLLNSACETIADNPGSYNSSLAKMYFDKAAKKSAAKISDQETKDRLIEIFRQIAEGQIQDIYGQAMLKESIALSVFQLANYLPDQLKCLSADDASKLEWEGSPLANSLAAMVTDSPQLNSIFNLARIAVFTHNDGRITQHMLNAAAAGLLVMTKAHPRDSRPEGLKGIFEPGKEIITYTTCPDLCRKVKLYLSNEDKRKELTNNTRQKLIANLSVEKLCRRIFSVNS